MKYSFSLSYELIDLCLMTKIILFWWAKNQVCEFNFMQGDKLIAKKISGNGKCGLKE